MCKKYIGLLLFILASVMYAGCSEDPFDWSGDGERPVPIPVDLSVEVVEDIVYGACSIEYHDDDLPILEVGFFYGDNSKVTYDTGKRVKSKVSNNGFSSSEIGSYSGENVIYSYVGAYITTSRGTITTGPVLGEYRR